MAEITNFKGEVQGSEEPESIDAWVNELMARVGRRVLKARKRKGIPRRILSEMSGVSPRYLAQLESGTGNISIGLLERVARALDHRIEWFVGVENPWTSDTLRIAELYRLADKDQRNSVKEILDPVELNSLRARRICLLGLRGAGKSTLGKMAGDALNVPFLELNREIEDHSGMPGAEAMALYGADGYRLLESQALQRVVASHEVVILAVAGGIVAEPVTYNYLLRNFHTIWLRASPDEHMSRVLAQGDVRPMTNNPNAMGQLRSLLSSREAMYQRACVSVDTSGKEREQSLEEMLDKIETHRFLV